MAGMIIMRTSTVRWCLPLALFLTAGCAQVRQGRRDPAFTPEALSTRGLAIGGMVSAIGDPAVRMQARAPLDSLLWTIMAHELQGTALAPLGHADEVLGPAGRCAALDALERYDTVVWGPEALRVLPDHEDALFLIFGRIDQDETFTSCATYPASADAKELIVHITTRRVGATFTVYALPEGRPVWSGRIVKTKSVGQSVDDSAEDGLLGAVLGLLFPGEQTPDYLPPAPFEVVAHKVFREFASQIAR